ncbi:MAG: alpha/beta family hydrolase [Actinomycetota bacterium]
MSGLVLTDEPSGTPLAGLLFAPGSRGKIDTPGWDVLASTLVGLGYLSVRFELPYRATGRKIPPKAQSSVPGFLEALDVVRGEHPGVADWYLGGASYGGRVASLAVAAGATKASGLVFLGYPLHAFGRKDSLRVEHWPQIGVASLFFAGTKDNMCDLGLLGDCLPTLGAEATLEVIEGGNHSLGLGRAQPDFAHFAHLIHAWITSVKKKQKNL